MQIRTASLIQITSNVKAVLPTYVLHSHRLILMILTSRWLLVLLNILFSCIGNHYVIMYQKPDMI